MQYIQFKDALKEFVVFSLIDIQRANPHFHHRRLIEWQKKGYIRKVIKGYYVFSDLPLNEAVLFKIANRIYSPSYISFEMALAYHGLIPEAVYGLTSASTLRTYRFKTSLAEFIYTRIKPELFFGYQLVQLDQCKDQYVKIASLEKAILDYFYIHTDIRDEDHFASLRFNQERLFQQLDENKLNQFLEKLSKKTVTKRVRAFLEFMRHAGS